MFKETHPILGTRDIQRAIAFYTQRLGFNLAFGDKADPPNYVGFRREPERAGRSGRAAAPRNFFGAFPLRCPALPED
jgi:catechol 2,3-dioxygenase-like lactoylglutathione lyase family enzyme